MSLWGPCPMGLAFAFWFSFSFSSFRQHCGRSILQQLQFFTVLEVTPCTPLRRPCVNNVAVFNDHIHDFVLTNHQGTEVVINVQFMLHETPLGQLPFQTDQKHFASTSQQRQILSSPNPGTPFLQTSTPQHGHCSVTLAGGRKLGKQQTLKLWWLHVCPLLARAIEGFQFVVQPQRCLLQCLQGLQASNYHSFTTEKGARKKKPLA